MKKVLFTICAVILLNILPFIFHPDLLRHGKIIFLIVSACCIWLTQPAFSIQETKGNREADKFSILIILLAGSISIVSANIEWQKDYPDIFSNAVVTTIGLCMILSGISLRVWAIRTLGKYFTATVRLQQKQALITTGPYQLVRHPSYLGAFLAIVGCAVFLNAYFSIIISIFCMTISYIIRIHAEEKVLVQHFGEQYLLYSQKTKKLFPFIW